MNHGRATLPITLALLLAACGGGPSSSGGSSTLMQLTEASNGFGLLLPYQVFKPGPNGLPTQQLIAIRTTKDLVDNVTPSNPILPVIEWPTTASLPDGDPGNHFIYIEFDQDVQISSVLDKSPAGQANSGLIGPVQVLAIDPANAQSIPVLGRVFIGGKSYYGPDPDDPPNLKLEQLVELDPSGKPVAVVLANGDTPGLGFPGTEDATPFPGSAKLLGDNVLVFVVDSDGDLTTHDDGTFPVNRQIQMRASTATRSVSNKALKYSVVAGGTVGTDTLPPEVLVTAPPGSVPLMQPAFGDTDVDPETTVTILFSEPIQPLTLGSLLDGNPPQVSSSVELKFGPATQQTKVPFHVMPESVFNLTTWTFYPTFAFPGSGPALAQCGTYNQVNVDVITAQFDDLASAANKNQLPANSFFTTGEGPGIVNAPVSPDAIYVGRTGAIPGVAVIDLNGFGQGTGNPTFDFTYKTFPPGNTNFPNNPNLVQYGPNLHPPVFPGTCTIDGGSGGAFTLTKDSSLDDLLIRSPLISTIDDIMIGQALDVVFNNGKDTTGCQTGGGNFCAITGKKLISTAFETVSTLGPPQFGQLPASIVPGGANQINWGPHPNPPALIFPPLCLQPYIGGQEPTSIYSSTPVISGGLGLSNLLVPGVALGDPLNGTPPSGLLARYQNAYFEGPDRASLPNSGACFTYMVRQQVGQFLYLIDRGRREVVVLNSNRFSVIDRIPLADPTDLAMGPNLDFLAVSNQKSDTVSFIDIDPRSSGFHQVVKETTVGRAPRGIAWDPGNEDIMVCNEGEDSVSIISAFGFNVRRVVKGSLNGPFDVVISQRQLAWGYFRDVYFAWILNRNGNLTLFESGPNGTNGWGFDDTIGVVPFSFENPKKITLDVRNVFGAVWVVHENPIDPATGNKTNLPGGAVSRVNISGGLLGLLPLGIGNFLINPQFRDLSFSVEVSIGPSQLTGIPVDIAFDNLNNLGGVSNAIDPKFAAGQPILLNGKSTVKLRGATYVPSYSPDYMFLAVPNSNEGPGVVDVISLNSGFTRFDTSAYLPGVQSIPAPGVILVSDYWRQ